jgi:hypothetical protein
LQFSWYMVCQLPMPVTVELAAKGFGERPDEYP